MNTKQSSANLAPVAQRLDNAIHGINHYPADNVVYSVNIYPLDSVMQPLNNRGLEVSFFLFFFF